MRKLLCKSSSTLSLIAFAGIVVVVLVFSGPAGSLTLTRAPPRTPLVATRQKLPAPPISEAGEDKRKTGSPQSVGTAPTPPNPGRTAPSSPSDEWSADEIKEELKECTRLLAPIYAEFEPEKPMKHRQCGAPAPIRLRALGEGETRVEFLPPVTVTCRLAAGLYRWIETSLQPAAREMLGSPITRISEASKKTQESQRKRPFMVLPPKQVVIIQIALRAPRSISGVWVRDRACC